MALDSKLASSSFCDAYVLDDSSQIFITKYVKGQEKLNLMYWQNRRSGLNLSASHTNKEEEGGKGDGNGSRVQG